MPGIDRRTRCSDIDSVPLAIVALPNDSNPGTGLDWNLTARTKKSTQ